MEGAIKAVGGAPKEPQLSGLAAAGHMGFGTVGGSAFAGVREQMGWKRHPVLAGVGYGLGIWLLSYKGWVPALGFMPPAEKDRTGRVVTNIAAHILYGALLGAGIGRVEKRRN